MIALFQFFKKYYRTTLVLIIIFFLSTVSGDEVESVHLFRIENLDKVVHLLMYLFLSSILAFEIIKNNREYPLMKIIAIIVLVPLIYGGVLELVQEFFTETRSGEWADFAFDAFGILLSVPLFVFFIRKLKSRIS